MNIELFRAAEDYARNVTSGLRGDVLALPTPCEGWDTGTVVLHLADVATALVGLVENGELRMPDSPTTEATDPVRHFHNSLTQLATTLSTTSHVQRADAAMQAGTIEMTMHGWDIGVARDHGYRIPAYLAGEVLVVATSLIDDDARGANFAAPVETEMTAPASDRLAAFLGRQPGRPTASRAS